jgi:diguanylate cyclase (GGDEF)-like protein
VNGDFSRTLASHDISMSDGVSGWVAENKKPMVNGNPSVEPAFINEPNKSGLPKSALSVPLLGAEQLSGALTVYRAERDAYTRQHLRVLQAVVGKISRALESAVRPGKAQRAAGIDELTALPNARSLYLRLEEDIALAGHEKREFAVMLCDLDGFKYVNETFGALAGNELLQRVAAILREQCRETDYVARTGGDEFVVLLAGSRGDALQVKIDSLNRAIRRAARDVCGEDKVGLSVGVACHPEHGDNAEALLCHAEDELYRAKRSRRVGAPLQFPGNKVQVA